MGGMVGVFRPVKKLFKMYKASLVTKKRLDVYFVRQKQLDSWIFTFCDITGECH